MLVCGALTYAYSMSLGGYLGHVSNNSNIDVNFVSNIILTSILTSFEDMTKLW